MPLAIKDRDSDRDVMQVETLTETKHRLTENAIAPHDQLSLLEEPAHVGAGSIHCHLD
ncbi:hypothetical protein [Laspinema palackyanum]|uniref:hypothetical protein n=1 Tax=Laspinema palackyanum TaxID=3231601 RepID=UPI00345C7E5E|nr:hypothetical protein [Laspinema sp. D2c]